MSGPHATPAADTLLRIDNLSAGYGAFQVLFDVSLEVKAGESVAVIGPNGAGKTTLLRAISKLIEPTAGQLHMAGQRYDGRPAHEVISLGIAQVPEGRRLFPRLTVEDNLRMGGLPAGGAGALRAAAGDGLRAVPAHEGAARTAGRHHVGR